MFLNLRYLLIIIIFGIGHCIAEEKHGQIQKGELQKKSEVEDDHNEHGVEENKSIGKGKAVEAIDKNNGFKLSKEAMGTLGLKYVNVEWPEFRIIKGALVVSQGKNSIYRFRKGFFKLMDAKVLKELDGFYIVNVRGIERGDQIVTEGIGYLSVTDIYANDKSEYEHSH
jgi:hypothetical protein